MSNRILTSETAGISEFKKNPLTVINHSESEAITILHNNTPAFCCVSLNKYKELLAMKDQLDQYKLLLIKANYQEALAEDKQNTLIDSEEFFNKLMSGDFD